MPDDRVLSQSDIDALIESVAPQSRAAKEKGIITTTPKPGKEVEPERATAVHPSSHSSLSPYDIKALNDKIAELANRLDKLEKALSKTRQSANDSLGVAQFAQNFRCTSCNSQGFIAFFVKCTNCGQVKLWGSWPQNSRRRSMARVDPPQPPNDIA